MTETTTGIYCGWASVGSDSAVYKMVMSVGWNPFYKNEKKTAEPWLLHTFPEDFYGMLHGPAGLAPPGRITCAWVSMQGLAGSIHSIILDAQRIAVQDVMRSILKAKQVILLHHGANMQYQGLMTLQLCNAPAACTEQGIATLYAIMQACMYCRRGAAPASLWLHQTRGGLHFFGCSHCPHTQRC